MLVAGSVLLAFLPILHHAWTFAASRTLFAALIVIILALGIGAVLLVNSAISDPVYFVPIAGITVALRLSSPFLLYRRIQDRLEVRRWWSLFRWSVAGGFVVLVAILAYHLVVLASGTEPANVAIFSEQLVMALGASILIVRAGLRMRPRGDAGGCAAGGEFLVLGFFQDLDRPRLDLAGELEFGTEPRHIVLRLRRHQLELELAGHEPVRAADLLAAHAGRIRDLVEGPRHVALPARRVQGRRDDAFDRPTADQVLVHRLAVHHRGRLSDVPREAHAACHPVQLAQREREVALRRVAHADPALPLPESVQLGAVPGGDRLAVRILVLPSDRRREAFVVDRVCHRRAGAGALLALFHVEGPPLGALVDHLVGQDEATFFADELAALVVEREVARIAFRASSDFFGFFDLLGRHGLPQR